MQSYSAPLASSGSPHTCKGRNHLLCPNPRSSLEDCEADCEGLYEGLLAKLEEQRPRSPQYEAVTSMRSDNVGLLGLGLKTIYRMHPLAAAKSTGAQQRIKKTLQVAPWVIQNRFIKSWSALNSP